MAGRMPLPLGDTNMPMPDFATMMSISKARCRPRSGRHRRRRCNRQENSSAICVLKLVSGDERRGVSVTLEMPLPRRQQEVAFVRRPAQVPRQAEDRADGGRAGVVAHRRRQLDSVVFAVAVRAISWSSSLSSALPALLPLAATSGAFEAGEARSDESTTPVRTRLTALLALGQAVHGDEAPGRSRRTGC